MFLITILAPEMALAQLGARAPASTSVATQLPLSGRSANSGSVATTQTPIPGATTSVNTINTTVQVSGPFAGSSPSNTPFSGKLSFNEAIQRGLEFNLGATGQAHGSAAGARAIEGGAQQSVAESDRRV